VIALAWHPTSDLLSFTTSNGQLYRWKDCIPSGNPPAYGGVKKAPNLNNNFRPGQADSSDISRSPSILSRTNHGAFGLDDDEDDDFIIDDDGAGYVPGYNRKRQGDWDENPFSKRGRSEYGSSFRVKIHEPFQSGSTPWKGSRRYLSKYSLFAMGSLCLACNMIGHVWTVDQDTHNTVTCEFYDREAHHQFFFTDPYLYDKACLSEFPF
jgi:chromosome transmission fidelity protein 4